MITFNHGYKSEILHKFKSFEPIISWEKELTRMHFEFFACVAKNLLPRLEVRLLKWRERVAFVCKLKSGFEIILLMWC